MHGRTRARTDARTHSPAERKERDTHCDFKGVLVRREVADRFDFIAGKTSRIPPTPSARLLASVRLCVLRSWRGKKKKKQVEKNNASSRCIPAPGAMGGTLVIVSIHIPIFFYPPTSQSSSLAMLRCDVSLDIRHVVFLTEAETRQKLLRNVKKEVGSIFSFHFISSPIPLSPVTACVYWCCDTMRACAARAPVDVHVHQPRVHRGLFILYSFIKIKKNTHTHSQPARHFN